MKLLAFKKWHKSLLSKKNYYNIFRFLKENVYLQEIIPSQKEIVLNNFIQKYNFVFVKIGSFINYHLK